MSDAQEAIDAELDEILGIEPARDLVYRCLFCNAVIIDEDDAESYWIVDGPKYSGFCSQIHYDAWREHGPRVVTALVLDED